MREVLLVVRKSSDSPDSHLADFKLLGNVAATVTGPDNILYMYSDLHSFVLHGPIY